MTRSILALESDRISRPPIKFPDRVIGKGNRSPGPIPQTDRSPPQARHTKQVMDLKTGLFDRQICKSGHWPLSDRKLSLLGVTLFGFGGRYSKTFWGWCVGVHVREDQRDVIDSCHLEPLLCSFCLSQFAIVSIWQVNNNSVFSGWNLQSTLSENSSYNFFHGRRNPLGCRMFYNVYPRFICFGSLWDVEVLQHTTWATDVLL